MLIWLRHRLTTLCDSALHGVLRQAPGILLDIAIKISELKKDTILLIPIEKYCVR